jgi:hypothetical protein
MYTSQNEAQALEWTAIRREIRIYVRAKIEYS